MVRARVPAVGLLVLEIQGALGQSLAVAVLFRAGRSAVWWGMGLAVLSQGPRVPKVPVTATVMGLGGCGVDQIQSPIVIPIPSES